MIDINYSPQLPLNYHPAIGLIGCGGITEHHLQAYRNAELNVVALCDINREAAEKRACKYFPDAQIFTDYRDLLRNDDIEVVDVATHPPERPQIIEECLRARKHTLSQKPFVLDLDIGQQLVDLANQCEVKLAVNQNGRWAPHFSYMRSAVEQGILGEISGIHMSVHWDHTWTKGTEFEKVKHLILYDFAIHWFDMVNCLLSQEEPRRVYASLTRSKRQTIMPPLLGQSIIEFNHAQASLAFDADTDIGPNDRAYVTGTRGSIHSNGRSYQDLSLTMDYRDDNGIEHSITPNLDGKWFPDGFQGTMGELLCSIEENRTPSIDAARNLKSLAMCFAAVASAESGQPQTPGEIRSMPGQN